MMTDPSPSLRSLSSHSDNNLKGDEQERCHDDSIHEL